MYQVFSKHRNIETINIPLTNAFQLDVDAILSAQSATTKMILFQVRLGNCFERQFFQF